MGRKAKIEKLPKEVQSKILQKRMQGKTLRQVERELKEEGYDVNYENIRRWEKRYENVIRYMTVRGEEVSEEELFSQQKFLLQNLSATYAYLQSILSKLSQNQEPDLDLLERQLRLVAEALQINTKAISAVHKITSIEELLEKRRQKAKEKLHQIAQKENIKPEIIKALEEALNEL